MHCPVCKDPHLVMTERQGIEIDYCPSCRGVWLDRGELDKLIEKSLAAQAPAAAQPYPPPQRPSHAPERHERYDERTDSRYGSKSDYRHKKSKSWLSDLFD